MATVRGPSGDLFDSIEDRLSQPRRTKKKGDGKPERFGVKRNIRLEKFRAKGPADYNANDLALLISREWKAKGWKSKSPRFTMRDRGHAKSLIEDHGAEDVATAIEYMIRNWADICRRYRVTGFPSIRVLYGFRHSWIPESVEGVKHGASAGAEFNDEDSDEIASGSWE